MAKKPKKQEETQLLQALRFVSAAQRESGTVNQTHCRLVNNSVVAYDGVLACGVTLNEALPTSCPNTLQLIKALERTNDIAAVKFAEHNVTVKTSKFRATVNCVGNDDLLFINPDLPTYPLTLAFAKAAATASAYTKENAQHVIGASVLLRNGSIIGTDGKALLEVWHGEATPEGIVLPKSFVDAINKAGKPISHFGYSATTFTVWFEDKSWIKTQLYMEPWPDVDRVLADATGEGATDIPSDLLEAIKTVAAFSDDGKIYFGEGYVQSHRNVAQGAAYSLSGLPSELSFDIKTLTTMLGLTSRVNWNGSHHRVYFYGENIRGVIIKSSY